MRTAKPHIVGGGGLRRGWSFVTRNYGQRDIQAVSFHSFSSHGPNLGSCPACSESESEANVHGLT